MSVSSVERTPHYMFSLLHVQREKDRLTQKELDCIDSHLSWIRDRIEHYDQEFAETCKKRETTLESEKRWSTFTKVAQYIGSSASIGLGLGCLATGTGSTAGLALVASGAIALANRAGDDLGAWRSIAKKSSASIEKQIEMTKRIDIALTSISLSLSMGGAISAYNARALELLSLGKDPILRQAAKSLALLQSGTNALLKVKEGQSENKRCSLDADLKTISAQPRIYKERLKVETGIMSARIKHSEEMDRVVKNSISNF